MAISDHTKGRKAVRSVSPSQKGQARKPAAAGLRRPRFVNVPIAELQAIALRLQLYRSVAIIAVEALKTQAADHDIDIANALHIGIADTLTTEISRLESLFRGGLP